MKLLALLLLAAASMTGHDLQVSVTPAPPAVILRCAYSGEDPAAFAKVLVFAPGQEKSEFQNARTDANGAFSFVPDRAGQWRVVVDDEIGHREQVLVPYSSSAPQAAAAAAVPLWQRLGAGIALIAGLCGVYYGWSRRRG